VSAGVSIPASARRLTAGTVLYSFAMFVVLAVVTVSGAGQTTTLKDVDFIATGTNDPPGTIDPGYTKNVASCVSSLINSELIEVTIDNGYPSYTCTFTVAVQNTGLLGIKLNPLEFDVPPVLTVIDLSDDAGIELGGGDKVVETFSVHVEQPASQGATYTFQIRKPFRLFHKGTIGFWRAWNNHNTFTRAQIETWLVQIDDGSSWFGPRTAEGMVSMMDGALRRRATARDKFLGHCLATRMNERAGILDGSDTHNVTGVDAGNYLGLATPSSATLNQIIAAIESKFGNSPGSAQFMVMKSVCDDLNNLLI